MKIVKYTEKYVGLAHDFKCGNIVLDNFLKDGSALDENRGITYVMLTDDEDAIIGYYNIENGRVDLLEEVGGEMVFSPMGGSININYLAIHSNFQGTKIAEIDGKNIYLGDIILRDCEKRILNLRQQVGISFVTLYSTKEGYNLYHNRNDYEEFEDDMNTVVSESDSQCYKLYKCVDDIVE